MQNSFNARVYVPLLTIRVVKLITRIKSGCDSRKYTYFFPSYLLLPPKPGSGLDRTLQQYVTSLPPISSCAAPLAPRPEESFWSTADASREDELRRKRAWRVGPELVEKLRSAARKYEGTHNFHNFTVGREFGDRSNQRHMKHIEVRDFLVEITTCLILDLGRGPSGLW